MEIPWWRSLERLTFTRTLGLSGGVGGMEVFEIQLSWDCHFFWHQDPKVQRLMKWTWYGYMESPWNEAFFSFSFPVHNPQQASTPQIFSMVLFLILWPGSAWSLHVDMDAVYMRSLQEDLYLYLYIYISIISAIGSFDSHNRCVWDRNGPNQQAQRWATVSNGTNDFPVNKVTCRSHV